MIRGLGILAALAMAAATDSSREYHASEEREATPEPDTKKSYEPKKQGMQEFSYPDGFTCQALNKKNADKKHAKWTREK